MEKTLAPAGGVLVPLLLFFLLPGCYLVNTTVQPNPAGFHLTEVPPFGPPPGGPAISGIAGNGSVSVAVSHDSAVIAYSEDSGVTWKTAEIGNNFSDGIRLNAVTWGEGWFLAGGDSGKAAYSRDGISWQAGVIGPMSPKNILTVAIGSLGGKKVFVAAGNDGRIAHSPEGPEGPWFMTLLSPFGTVEDHGEAIRDMAYGKVEGMGVFVAVGDSGKIAFMKDLSGRWYGGRAGTDQTFRSAAFGNDKFIAVGDNGMIKICADPLSYTWTTVTDENLGLRPFIRIGFDPVVKNFILVCAESIVAFSEYGHFWNAVTFERYFARGISAIGCGDSRILLGGADGTIAYSNE
jgi:hypothetical protein